MNEELHKVVNHEYDKIIVPDMKEELWKKISSGSTSIRRKHSKSWRILIASAAVVLIMTFVVSLKPQGASAYAWIKEIFLSIKGTSTQISGTIGGNGQAPPMISLNEKSQTHSIAFDELSSSVSFQSKVPTYLPTGYSLNNISVNTQGDSVIFLYTNGSNMFTIEQTIVNSQQGSSIIFDNEDTVTNKVDFNGIVGNLVAYKDGTTMLLWVDMNRQYIISTKNLDSDELIEIAKSMK